MKWISVVLLALVSACSVGPAPPKPGPQEPQAFLALANNAKTGGMRITSINDKPVAESDGHLVPAGSHHIRFACKLDNGIGATFAVDTELLANHSYCFFSKDEGKSCTMMYTRTRWNSGDVTVCN